MRSGFLFLRVLVYLYPCKGELNRTHMCNRETEKKPSSKTAKLQHHHHHPYSTCSWPSSLQQEPPNPLCVKLPIWIRRFWGRAPSDPFKIRANSVFSVCCLTPRAVDKLADTEQGAVSLPCNAATLKWLTLLQMCLSNNIIEVSSEDELY